MDSKFTGGLFGLIGIGILQYLMIIFTLGLATPWAICLRERWFVKHTVIDGHKLTFDGKGGQLFGKYILWYFLSVITVGIFALWVPIKMKAWVTKHTHLEVVA